MQKERLWSGLQNLHVVTPTSRNQMEEILGTAIRCRHRKERNQVYSRSGRENLSKQCESWVPDTGKVIGADERYSGSDNTATKLGTAALIKKSR